MAVDLTKFQDDLVALLDRHGCEMQAEIVLKQIQIGGEVITYPKAEIRIIPKNESKKDPVKEKSNG